MTSVETQKRWIIDKAHSNLEFSVRHMMIANVKGRFTKFDGDIILDPENIENSKFKIEIDASSIYTNEEDRDKDLRSPNFLNVEKFPVVRFESTRVSKKGNNLETVGNLTIRDVTREIVVVGELQGPIIDPYKKKRIGYDGEATFNRKDFGLTWNMVLEGGGVLVGDTVKVNVHMEVTSD